MLAVEKGRGEVDACWPGRPLSVDQQTTAPLIVTQLFNSQLKEASCIETSRPGMNHAANGRIRFLLHFKRQARCLQIRATVSRRGETLPAPQTGVATRAGFAWLTGALPGLRARLKTRRE